jgi:DNA-binding NtrC family response regulator
MGFHDVGPGLGSPILGVSSLIESVRKALLKLLKTDGNILLQGEPGTGNRLVALRIHLNSTRKDGPFIVIDCADKNIGKHLLESLEAAKGGTLFIENITALGRDLQQNLLIPFVKAWMIPA